MLGENIILNYTSQKRKKVIPVLIIMLITAICLSFLLGRYAITPREFFGILFSQIFDIEPFWNSKMVTVIKQIRLPRILLSCMIGCCLATAGVAYQGVFQNPMAAPDILGASAGAGFGAALAIINGSGSVGITVSSFVFGMLTIACVFLLGNKAAGNRILGLVLSGIMVSALFSAGTSFLKLIADPKDQLPAITYWLMGSLSSAKVRDVKFSIIPMLIGIIPIYLLRWKINILTLGDEEASALGVNPKKIRYIVILSATLLTASSVSVCGVIGWIGLVIPHIARRIVGNNYIILIPTVMLLGALFLLIVDNISRNLFATEIPLGILTAVIGAPFFIYLITREGEIL